MSEPDRSPTTSQSASYAAIVGERLRAIRRQRRLSLQAVASASAQEFRASALGAYERGERAISVPRLQRLARLYNVPVEQLLPADYATTERSASRAEQSHGEAITLDLNELAQAPGEHVAALRRFVDSILRERQQFGVERLTIRREDLRVIGAAFGLSAEGMVVSLKSFGVIRRER